MSRITGSDAKGLMEAYSSVYAPQELTEEQVWEEVENWVNSLLEEGYDLSEYTWEEMYEAYIEEAPVSPVFNTKGFGDFYNRQATSQGMDKTFRAGGGQAALRAGKTPLDIMKQGAANLRSSTSTRTPAAPAARPAAAAPAARPAAAPAARPAAAPAAPKVAPKPAAATPAPAPSTPRQKDTSITDMIGRSQVRQGAPVNTGSTSSDARAIAAKASVGAAPKPAAAPARPMGGARGRMLGASFDPFDVIKGHLLDEGYADTEEAALKIMANMSEEWKQSIVEGNQRNPESDERTPKSDEAIPGQAARKMPRRGHHDREEFEKWYRANVR